MLTDRQKKRLNRGANVIANDDLGAMLQSASGIVDNLGGCKVIKATLASDDISDGAATVNAGIVWTNVLAVYVLSSAGEPRAITAVAHAAAGDKTLKVTATSVTAGDILTAIVI